MKISRSMRIGIIGGKGRTGSQFAALFRNTGFRVSVTGEKTRHRNQTLFATCDIVVFSVPLQLSKEIMRKEIVNAVRKDQLILDVCSLKTEQMKILRKAAGEVISMHPMFGPRTPAAGQAIVLCPVQCRKETLHSLGKLLRTMGMQTVVVKPDEHDQLMGFVQALPHLKSMLVAAALTALGANFKTIDRVSAPPYELELDLVGRFLDDDPMLYGPIIVGNQNTARIIKTLQKLLADFAVICKRKDYSRFSKHYRRLQRRFGAKRLARARRRSEIGIRALTHSPHS